MPSLVDLRHFISILCGVVLLWIATRGGYLSYLGGISLVGIFSLFVGLFVLGIGLVMNWFWPRRIAAVLCVLGAVFLPITFFNPFAVIDGPVAPRSVKELLPRVGLLIAGLLLLAWLLNPPRVRRAT